MVPEIWSMTRVFQIVLRGGWVSGIFFTGGGIAQGILSIFQGYCDAQINIPYILNIS